MADTILKTKILEKYILTDVRDRQYIILYFHG